jgi:hypothetical protein
LGRAYSQIDLPALTALASASGYISVLILALYINSPEVSRLYRHVNRLWYVCPLLTYWISRLIMLASRGEMHDDPIVFAFRDKASWTIALSSLGLLLSALVG